MPYFFETDKIKLPYNLDRRRKLTKQDRATIKDLHGYGMSIREITRKFANKCCRRTIQFVLFPERLIPIVASHDSKKYYDKDKHRESMKKYRNYKYKILKNKYSISAMQK